MKDRQPTPGQEGRVLITPESGAPFYARVAMADNPLEQGTPINKATLWTDATASLFGLDGDSLPDDGMAFIGRYNLYWWHVIMDGVESYTQSPNRHAYPDNGAFDDEWVPITRYFGESMLANGSPRTIRYANSVRCDSAGNVLLVSPVSLTVNPVTDNFETLTQTLKGKYVADTFTPGVDAFFFPDTSMIMGWSSGGGGAYIKDAYAVESQFIEGKVQYRYIGRPIQMLPVLAWESINDGRVQALEDEVTRLRASVSLQAQQMSFLEDCILEMADEVYA